MGKKAIYLFLGVFFFSTSGCMQKYYNTATHEEEVYFYSTEKEVKIGESLSRQVEKMYKPDMDLLIQQRVNDIGQRVAVNSERKDIRYYFKVLDEKEINAFALPGGYVYMFKGLWDKVSSSDDQVAAVLAHEIAHISARHSIKRLQASLGYNILTVMVATSSEMDTYSRAKAMAGINELILDYSREDELQADELAVRYLNKAGYSSAAVIGVLDVLQEDLRKRPVAPIHARTHPYLSERKKVVRENMSNGNISFDDYINTEK